jgi:hypothetical protein
MDLLSYRQLSRIKRRFCCSDTCGHLVGSAFDFGPTGACVWLACAGFFSGGMSRGLSQRGGSGKPNASRQKTG